LDFHLPDAEYLEGVFSCGIPEKKSDPDGQNKSSVQVDKADEVMSPGILD
jgi:hypothetical protein